eukprot:CAMPEP_0115100430 /NCGR_PEP_ID=MMETSP0227-20121206/32566_1 /TAXON_ID=89957 /ORGANISM="Polarella glacialis, Strain CCMP 1383" /LENGTH=79 /DNA_ID=CAMNT_0002495857 /DNA_START=107 /DNA_END=343 /DNA_ORIENTATION=+
MIGCRARFVCCGACGCSGNGGKKVQPDGFAAVGITSPASPSAASTPAKVMAPRPQVMQEAHLPPAPKKGALVPSEGVAA